MYISGEEVWYLVGAIVISIVMFWSGYLCGRSEMKPRRDKRGRFV